MEDNQLSPAHQAKPDSNSSKGNAPPVIGKPQSHASPKAVPAPIPEAGGASGTDLRPVKPAPEAKPGADASRPIPQTVQPARVKLRHWGLLLSFVLTVLLPSAGAAWYLWAQSVDQYASHVGFTVRREESPSAVDVLGGIANLSSSSSSDSDVLFEFIQSQELVRRIDNRLDLRRIYSAPYEADPIFALPPDSTIEELLNYWNRMTQISYGPGNGLIELKVLAFNPQDAQTIARTIFEESGVMINALSAVAREDSMRYAREELALSVEQLKIARQNLTTYRSENQIVDPSADIQLRMGLLTTLQQQLGTELITYDLLRESAREGDPRVVQSESRIAAINNRINQEREKFGAGSAVGPDGKDYANLVADFESLVVEREFAEKKYTSALSNYDNALAEAQRQSRYLAAYVQPTLSESSEYPRRALIMGLVGLFLFASWSILALIFYSLRDRR